MRRKNFHDSIISELNQYQGKMKSPKKMKTQKKWNVKNKNEISKKKKNDQKKFWGLKNLRTQSMSGPDNVRI